MSRTVAVVWHASFCIVAGVLYFFFVLPRWPELLGDTSHTLGTVLRIVAGALIGLAALPVVFTLLRTRRPEFGTPQLALTLRTSSIGLHVIAGVLIIGTAISEIWLTLDDAGQWLFGIYGAAAAIALLGMFAFYLAYVAELPPPPPKPLKPKKASSAAAVARTPRTRPPRKTRRPPPKRPLMRPRTSPPRKKPRKSRPRSRWRLRSRSRRPTKCLPPTRLPTISPKLPRMRPKNRPTASCGIAGHQARPHRVGAGACAAASPLTTKPLPNRLPSHSRQHVMTATPPTTRAVAVRRLNEPRSGNMGA